MGPEPAGAVAPLRVSLLSCLGLLLAAALLGSCSTAPKVPEEVFETRNQASNWIGVADALVRRGQYESAVKYYRQAIDAYASVDHLEGVAIARNSLGRLWLAWGLLDSAGEEFAKAADWARLSGSPRAISLAATGLGELAFRRGDHEAALARFDEAVVAAAKDEAALAIALHDRAGALYSLGKTTEARADLERSIAINTKLKRWSELAANHYLEASFLMKEGKGAEAVAKSTLALANDRKSENSPGVAADPLLLADLAAAQGRDEDAYWYWRRAFEAGLGSNLPALARRALEGLIEGSPKAGRAGEVEAWRADLDKLAALSPPR